MRKYCPDCDMDWANTRAHCRTCGGPLIDSENLRLQEPVWRTETEKLSRGDRAFRKVSRESVAESENRTHKCRDRVLRLRGELFGSSNPPFSTEAEMCRWIRKTFDVQGPGTVYSSFVTAPTGERRFQGAGVRSLNFPENGTAVGRPVAEGGKLDELRVASETVAREIYETVRPDVIQKAHATHHILTGTLPLLAPIYWSVDLLHPEKGLSIRKNFDSIPSSLMAHIDRKAKQILTENWGVNFRERSRPSPISATAKSFLKRREGKDRWEVLTEWNRQYPENQYLHPNSLYRHLYRR